MALAQGVGGIAGLNERTAGLLTRMALAMRAKSMPRVSLRWRIGGDGIIEVSPVFL